MPSLPDNVRQKARLPKAKLPKAFLTSLASARHRRHLFDQIETYCMFIGYGRSGHSLVGSLLDAHPEAVISHELNALRYFRAGFSRRQVYALILDKERRDAEAGRWSGNYQYAVPHQWQGRFRQLRVIGDKKGAGSTSHVIQHRNLIGRVRKAVGVSLRFVHVTRNPYDNIATMMAKMDRTPTLPAAGERRRREPDRSVVAPTLADTIDHYFALCEGVAEHKRAVAEHEVIDLRQEDLLADPPSFLRRLCAFVDLEASDDYITDCTSILYTSPKRTRKSALWTPQLTDDVAEQMTRYPFLTGYTFES